ncbi:uncharacterized protein LOC105848313 [Hydra vulgaris]|uniref:uncharacterized protein LOC105848313 n=1 Tax=Hydra vulgaris TaxID=6087 RepID=UPI001F5EA125|nr:uncharacterized protein LOC105848313 [Hydra vulgaris]XP_047136372.1 uncharacterized protein LOC105848313 [Hydra vulgaris]
MELLTPPQCKYCLKTYSKLKEPIYTVCTCENRPKFAHGSCFRDWLKTYKYGVCEICLAKSKLVRNGYKNLRKWNLPQNTSKTVYFHLALLLVCLIAFLCFTIWWLIEQCWQPSCFVSEIVIIVIFAFVGISFFCFKESRFFLINIRVDNSNWKVVQCKEVIKQKKKKSIRRLSSIPSIRHSYKNSINFFKDGEICLSSKGTPYSIIDEKHIDMAIVWTPRDYPRVKKVVEHERKRIPANNHKKGLYIQKNKRLGFNKDEINAIPPNISWKNDFSFNINKDNTIYACNKQKLKLIEASNLSDSQNAVMPLKNDVIFKTIENGFSYINDLDNKDFEKNVYLIEPSVYVFEINAHEFNTSTHEFKNNIEKSRTNVQKHEMYVHELETSTNNYTNDFNEQIANDNNILSSMTII